MPSSAGLRNPQFRSRLLLAAIPLAALAASLLLAFASAIALRAHAAGEGARPTTVSTPLVTQATPPAIPAIGDAGSARSRPPMLWGLLAPWAFGVDAIALLGLAAVLIVRYNAPRRRETRT